MRVVDDFGGDDERSMLADNTSAFNCRLVPGTSAWAQHAYGLAVDINPLENPEIRNGQADPPAVRPGPTGHAAARR
jgi:poly-gamma-glutamate synthesis protein (capsule biosynthesis protein)